MANTRHRRMRPTFHWFDLTFAIIGSLMVAGIYLAGVFNLFLFAVAISVIFWCALPAGTTTRLARRVLKAHYQRPAIPSGRRSASSNYLAIAIGLLVGAFAAGILGLYLILSGSVDSYAMRVVEAACIVLSPCTATGSLWFWLDYKEASRTPRRPSAIGAGGQKLLAGAAELQQHYRRVPTT